MRVKCFGCDTRLEADTVDDVVEAFLAHAKTDHAWSYPEQALRNFARNFAEAELRVTGPTERLAEIPAVTIHPATDERVDDWLYFFDHDGFAGNPDWASCYCLEPHVPATPELPERAWRDARAAMAGRLRACSTFGYLAYPGDAGSRAVGWVNASLRSDYGLYRLLDPDGPDAQRVIGVSCFVVAPPYRRHGVAAALLDRVIADAAERGASWIEGYPLNAPEPNDSGHFRGPRVMYEARGFEPVTVRERDTLMRRAV